MMRKRIEAVAKDLVGLQKRLEASQVLSEEVKSEAIQQAFGYLLMLNKFDGNLDTFMQQPDFTKLIDTIDGFCKTINEQL